MLHCNSEVWCHTDVARLVLHSCIDVLCCTAAVKFGSVLQQGSLVLYCFSEVWCCTAVGKLCALLLQCSLALYCCREAW